MNLFVCRLFCNYPFQEALKIYPFLGFRELCLDLAGGDIQGSEQIQRSVTLVGAFPLSLPRKRPPRMPYSSARMPASRAVAPRRPLVL